MTSDRLPKDDFEGDLEGLLDQFRELLKYYSPSCLVSDASDNDCVMASAIKPIFSIKISGSALTIKIDPHNCFSSIEIIKHIKAGQIVVIDAQGETEVSVIGGIISSVLKQKGAIGVIVDGAVRDIDEVRDMGFPLFSRAVIPKSLIYSCSQDNATKPIEVNVPIHCGGILVHPNDIIVADDVGVAVIPFNKARSVLERAKEIAKREGELSKKIKGRINIEEIVEMTKKVISHIS